MEIVADPKPVEHIRVRSEQLTQALLGSGSHVHMVRRLKNVRSVVGVEEINGTMCHVLRKTSICKNLAVNENVTSCGTYKSVKTQRPNIFTHATKRAPRT